EGRAEARHPDVLRRRELLADPTGRTAGCSLAVGGVPFDDQDGALEIGLAGEEKGDGTAHHTTADNDDIIGFQHTRSSPSANPVGRPRMRPTLLPNFFMGRSNPILRSPTTVYHRRANSSYADRTRGKNGRPKR